MQSLLDTHVAGLKTSSRLSRYYVENAILPDEVIRVLNEGGGNDIQDKVQKVRAGEKLVL